MSVRVVGTAVGCDNHCQITVGNVTLPKAVLSTVKIFAVWHNAKLAQSKARTMQSSTVEPQC